MGINVAVEGIGVFVGDGWVFVGDGAREGGIAVADATVDTTVGVPQATSKLSNAPMIKQAVRRDSKDLPYLGSGERI